MIRKLKFGWWQCLFILAVFSSVAGCSRDQVLADQFLLIPDRSWELMYQPEMTVHVKEQKGPYNVFVNLRHTDQYRYSNIFLLIHQKRESDALTMDSARTRSFGNAPEKVSKRVELILAEPDGRWTGSHSGNLYTSQQLVWKDYFFPDTGVFVLALEQNMRENPLKHIVAAGLRIELAQKR